jgi:hypothetical protein
MAFSPALVPFYSTGFPGRYKPLVQEEIRIDAHAELDYNGTMIDRVSA